MPVGLRVCSLNSGSFPFPLSRDAVLLPEHASVVGNIIFALGQGTLTVEPNCNIVSVFLCSMVEQVLPCVDFRGSRLHSLFLLRCDRGIPKLQRVFPH